jgi:hypothetical protein
MRRAPLKLLDEKNKKQQEVYARRLNCRSRFMPSSTFDYTSFEGLVPWRPSYRTPGIDGV